jgi:hypothetical protein
MSSREFLRASKNAQATSESAMPRVYLNKLRFRRQGAFLPGSFSAHDLEPIVHELTGKF